MQPIVNNGKLTLYSDAGFDKRTKTAYIAWCCDSMFVSETLVCKVKDNNEAEVIALNMACKYASDLLAQSGTINEVEIFTDSKIAADNYEGPFSVQHVSRDKNLADTLVRSIKEKKR